MGLHKLLQQEQPEIQKISNEIMRRSDIMEWFNLGLASGMAWSCMFIGKNNLGFTVEDMEKIVKECYDDKQFLDYFNRLLEEYKREE